MINECDIECNGHVVMTLFENTGKFFLVGQSTNLFIGSNLYCTVLNENTNNVF